MEYTVNRYPIDEWIELNGPDGLVRLAQAAEISSSYMSKIRNGRIPNRLTRLKICKALKKQEADVFIPASRGKAS